MILQDAKFISTSETYKLSFVRVEKHLSDSS